MNIYIPSYNRFQLNRAVTLRFWPKILPVNVAVRPEQVEFYKALIKQLNIPNATILPIGKDGVMATRNAILDHVGNQRVIILDDDISFSVRRDDHEYKLRVSTQDDLLHTFSDMHDALKHYAHVGVSCRDGNNRKLEDSHENTRAIRAAGFDVAVLNKHNLRYRLKNREDFDLTLRLLRLGYSNLVFYKYAQNQSMSNNPGGMYGSPEREAKAMEENAYELARLHPGFVKPVQKTTKSSWGGGTRWDVICYWKKAFNSSQGKTNEL